MIFVIFELSLIFMVPIGFKRHSFRKKILIFLLRNIVFYGLFNFVQISYILSAPFFLNKNWILWYNPWSHSDSSIRFSFYSCDASPEEQANIYIYIYTHTYIYIYIYIYIYSTYLLTKNFHFCAKIGFRNCNLCICILHLLTDRHFRASFKCQDSSLKTKFDFPQKIWITKTQNNSWRFFNPRILKIHFM